MQFTKTHNYTTLDMIRINAIFDKARAEHPAEKVEQERSWIQHLINENVDIEEIVIEAGVVFNYMEVLNG